MAPKSKKPPSAGWTMGAWAKGQLRRDASTKQQVGAAAAEMAGKRKRFGGGRPRTVEHKTEGFCRCADCRKARGER